MINDYVYDAWGNVIGGTAPVVNPFRWNAAFGYEFIPQTGLYHVGAREYDPRVGRWLQRDPIGVAGGHPNVYLYCFNIPILGRDPSGLEFVIFVHGSFGDAGSFEKSYISFVKQSLNARGHHTFVWSGATGTGKISAAGTELCNYVKKVRAKYPNEPIVVIGHSMGGNVATSAANQGAPIDFIVRLGTPTLSLFIGPEFDSVPRQTKVFNFYDDDDTTMFEWATLGNMNFTDELPDESANWDNCEVEAPGKGVEAHRNMRRIPVWKQIIEYFHHLKRGGKRR